MRTKLAEDEPGEPLRIEGRLLRASECRTPLGGYGLDLWQADREGNYHEPPDYRLRGRMVTKEDGTFAFETIMPGNYRLGGSFRPAHIHFRVYSPQGEVLLTSQLYFEGDPYLGEEDPCQPPNCFSNDADRIIRLMPATLDGQSGKMGMIPLFVETW
jgi:protocatechuate 3,4-dioxygenase beta subunit